MKLSRREAVLAVVAGAAILYGVTGIVIKPYIDRWKILREQRADTAWRMDQAERLIAQRERVAARLDALSAEVPVYPADQEMDVHWLSAMDRIAGKHGVNIARRQAGEEQRVGDAYELPIECRDWEGSLDAIVHFLFDLQSEGAMLDIRQLLIRPTGKGRLRGRFTLYCAYARAREEEP